MEHRKDLKGPDLLCSILIANYASGDDRCYPGVKRIADDMRLDVRSVQRVLRRLETKKVFKIIRGDGRGNVTAFELIKGDNSVTLSDQIPPVENSEERATELSPFTEEKGRQIEPERATVLRIKGDSSARTLYKPFKPLKNKRVGETPRPPSVDNRREHPAIVAIREVAERYPNKTLWDPIIARLGETPDVARLRETYVAWIGCGNNKLGYLGVLDWYETGKRDNRVSTNGNGAHAPPRDADCAKCGNDRRTQYDFDTSCPCPDCRPTEYKAWLRSRGKI